MLARELQVVYTSFRQGPFRLLNRAAWWSKILDDDNYLELIVQIDSEMFWFGEMITKINEQVNRKSILLNSLYTFLASWLFAVSVLYWPVGGEVVSIYSLEAIAYHSTTVFAISFLIALCITALLHCLLKFNALYSLLVAAVLCSSLVVIHAELPLLLGLIALWALILYYLWPKEQVLVKRPESLKPLSIKLKLIIIGVAVLHISIMSIIMVSRLKGFNAPTYDDGIFSQMFYQMHSNGSQVTTLERSYPLSHFAVHISPIYYLLLPFYSILPKPETLQVLQILVVASGIFPLYLITKWHKFPAAAQFYFSILYFFVPALSGSSLFGFHENCFLAPLLLWLFYVLERNHTAGIIITSILLISVKEDVVIYFIFIGFWLLFNKRWKAGAGLIIIPIIVFALEIFLLNKFGDGSLVDSRFPNVSAYIDMGIWGIIPTFILSPVYFLTQVFTTEKWSYILLMLLPFAFTPLLQRKAPSRLILLIPFIIQNLISSYPYLHMINFQYNYGNTVILLYLCVLFWSDMTVAINHNNWAIIKRKSRETYHSLLAAIALASAIIITGLLWHNHLNSYRYLKNNYAELEKVKLSLAEIPEAASVRASTFYTTALSNRQKIYDIGHGKDKNADKWQSDYYVYDLRYTLKEDVQKELTSLLNSGWVETTLIEDWLLIIKKEDLQ